MATKEKIDASKHLGKEQKQSKYAKLITLYYYDKRGRRINLSINYENALKEFKRVVNRSKNNMMLYGEYVTGDNYHIITVLFANYNYEKDTLIYIKREEL